MSGEWGVVKSIHKRLNTGHYYSLPIAGLTKRLSAVRNAKYLAGRAARPLNRYSEPIHTHFRSADQVDGESLAPSDAAPLVKCEAPQLDLLKIYAAVEHRLGIPAPRSHEHRAWINLQGVEHVDECTESAICWLGLGVESLSQPEEGLHAALNHRFFVQYFPLPR